MSSLAQPMIAPNKRVTAPTTTTADGSLQAIEVTVDANSIDTAEDNRDGHLRSPDFFDVANHPTATFTSTRVESQGGNAYRVTGDLSIRGTSREVTLNIETTAPVKDPWGNTRAAAEGTAKINRKDWGVNWNAALEAGGVLVSDKITLEFELSAIKSA